MFLSSANLLHPLIFNSNKESPVISSSYLRRGLPTGPLPWHFPISTSCGLLVLSTRTVWPVHRHLLYATLDICNYISLYSCSLRLGLHPTAFPWTGPNIFLSMLPAFLLMPSHCPSSWPHQINSIVHYGLVHIFCVIVMVLRWAVLSLLTTFPSVFLIPLHFPSLIPFLDQ